MGSIGDALKRAQEERDRKRQNEKGTPDASAEEKPLASPPPAGPSAKITPLADAIRQAPQAAQSAVRVQRQQQATETIVEDYAAKRKLNLPASLVVYHERAGAVAEQYRKIRDALLAENTKRDPQMLVVTSAIAGEGKTTTVLNLGLALVEMRENRVLLVDGCLPGRGRGRGGRWTLTTLLKMERERGLSEMPEAGAEEAPNFARATPWNHLYVVPWGMKTAAGGVVELLKSPEMRPCLRRLRTNFDWVLIDAPAALALPDAGLLGSLADGVIMTAALHHTGQEKVQTAIRRLRSMNVPVQACILTRG